MIDGKVDTVFSRGSISRSDARRRTAWVSSPSVNLMTGASCVCWSSRAGSHSAWSSRTNSRAAASETCVIEPVGLFGLTRMIARVREPMRRATSLTSMRQRPS